MSSDGLPPSGAWSGYYTYSSFHSLHRMQLQLTFSLNGLIDGDGIDDIHQFTIRGEFEPATRQARWTKAYIGMHRVEYEGVYDGRNILGVWTLAGGSGAFRIWPGSLSDGLEIREGAEAENFVVAELTKVH
jgi:hypothetical protein